MAIRTAMYYRREHPAEAFGQATLTMTINIINVSQKPDQVCCPDGLDKTDRQSVLVAHLEGVTIAKRDHCSQNARETAHSEIL